MEWYRRNNTFFCIVYLFPERMFSKEYIVQGLLYFLNVYFISTKCILFPQSIFHFQKNIYLRKYSLLKVINLLWNKNILYRIKCTLHQRQCISEILQSCTKPLKLNYSVANKLPSAKSHESYWMIKYLLSFGYLCPSETSLLFPPTVTCISQTPQSYLLPPEAI